MEMRLKQINTKPKVTNKFWDHHGNFLVIKHEFCDKIIKFTFIVANKYI